MSADAEDGDEVSFDPADVRRRLPSNISDRFARVLVCAVRNPDASPGAIGERALGEENGESSTIRALREFSRGSAGLRTFEGSLNDLRGHTGKARSFAELTPRQKAVIDFCARHDVSPGGSMTGGEMAHAISKLDRYRENDQYEANMSDSHPVEVVRRYGGLIPERRRALARMNDLVPGEDPDEVLNEAGVDGLNVRDLLSSAGLDLPDGNLDGLPAAGDDEDDEGTVGEATTSTTITGLFDDDYENHLDDDEFTDEDVTPGTTYLGVVNNVAEGAVWVTIAGDPDSVEDVSGPVWPEYLPSGETPDEYSRGDRVLIMSVDKRPRRDGIDHRFRLIDREPESAPEGATEDETPEDTHDEQDEQGDPVADRDEPESESDVFAPATEAEQAFRDRLDDLEAKHEARRDAVNASLTELREAVDELAERVPEPGAADAVDSVLATVEELDERTRELEDRLNHLDDELSTLDVRTRVGEGEPSDTLADHLRALRDAGFDINIGLEP